MVLKEIKNNFQSLMFTLSRIDSGVSRLLNRSSVIQDIIDERGHQKRKFGDQSQNPFGTGKEYSELANKYKGICNAKVEDKTVTWADILLEEVFEALEQEDPDSVRHEMIQVAAVAVAICERIDQLQAEENLAAEQDLYFDSFTY